MALDCGRCRFIRVDDQFDTSGDRTNSIAFDHFHREITREKSIPTTADTTARRGAIIRGVDRRAPGYCTLKHATRDLCLRYVTSLETDNCIPLGNRRIPAVTYQPFSRPTGRRRCERITTCCSQPQSCAGVRQTFLHLSS
jgi:hypothetical protein